MNRWRSLVLVLIALLLALGYLFAGKSAHRPAATVEDKPARSAQPIPPDGIRREEADIGTRSLPRAPAGPEQR
jgi:hypothetical protein